MERFKQVWKRLPDAVRRPIVLIVGCLLIVASVLTGWLPGPGGIPLFLIGIAVLATEFEQARRFRDLMLSYIERFSKWYRKHRLAGTLLIILAICAIIATAYLLYRVF